jgi:hypothetical protein
VEGEYLSNNKIKCISPLVLEPGYVPLSIAIDEGEFSAGEAVQYLYYKTPIIESITPTCGPERGFTQITVFG